jgi:hypothetical protein
VWSNWLERETCTGGRRLPTSSATRDHPFNVRTSPRSISIFWTMGNVLGCDASPSQTLHFAHLRSPVRLDLSQQSLSTLSLVGRRPIRKHAARRRVHRVGYATVVEHTACRPLASGRLLSYSPRQRTRRADRPAQDAVRRRHSPLRLGLQGGRSQFLPRSTPRRPIRPSARRAVSPAARARVPARHTGPRARARMRYLFRSGLTSPCSCGVRTTHMCICYTPCTVRLCLPAS